MKALLEAPDEMVVARPAGRKPVCTGVAAQQKPDRAVSILNPAQFVPADVHQTPPEIMKKDLPQRIHQLIELHGSPLLVVDRQKLIQEYLHFRRLLRRVRLYYAVKANPHPDIIRTFDHLDGCFDVASEGEMRHVLDQGVDPSRLILANTVKRPEALAYADKMGVNLFTFDSETELYKIARHAPGARVLCRTKVGNVGSQVNLSLKFGADPEQVIPLLLKARSLGLRAEGLSFHVGSQCSSYDNYLHAFEVGAAIVDEGRKKGLPITTVDIGGGFPIRQRTSEQMTVQTMGHQMRRDLDRLFPASVDLIAEPGRALCGPAGMLLTRVIGRSIRNNMNYYYLDDGVYGDFSGIVFDHSQYDFKALKRTPKYLSVLAGPTCDSFDTIATGVELPELEVGDTIYVPNIGAYSCASALTFNGIPPAKVLVI
jgi:ornithine decarboxylase